MMNSFRQNNDTLISEFNKLLFDHYYFLSNTAAYQGEYTTARNYISDLVKTHGELPVLLDLHAKINAQQGKFNEAEFLWKKCLNADPGNPAYISALNRINKLQKSKVFKRLLAVKILGVISFILLLLFVLFEIAGNKMERTAKIEMLGKQQAEMNIRLANIQNNIKANSKADDLIKNIANKIEKINGVTTKKLNDGLLVFFNEGLFTNRVKIKPNQEGPILQLTKVIEPYAGKISITILGCSDNLPIVNSVIYHSNNALSIARANAVYDIIYKNSRIPGEDLIIGSTSESNVPFPNSSQPNRLKNRTVLIKISPIKM